MNPLSIANQCVSLTVNVTRTSSAVTKFVKDVRMARSDLDAISQELLSLKTVLSLLNNDVKESNSGTFPQTLKKQIAGIVKNCSGVVVQIEEILKKHEGIQISRAASGKRKVAELKLSLEAHKSALALALNMVKLTLAKDIKADTREIREDTSAIRQDTARILALLQRLPRDADRIDASRFMLDRYLDDLTSYAETLHDNFTDDIDAGPINQEQSPILISPPPRTLEEFGVND